MRLWSLGPALLDRQGIIEWSTEPPAPHPRFVVVPGDVASWERA